MGILATTFNNLGSFLIEHGPSWLGRSIYRMAFGPERRLDFYEQLQAFFTSHVSPSASLETMASIERDNDRNPNSIAARIYNNVNLSLNDGSSETAPFATALAPYIPGNEAILLTGGEQAGKIESALTNISFIARADLEISHETRLVIRRCLFAFLMFVTAMLINAFWVLPEFDKVYPMAKWQGMGASMVWMINYIKYGLIPTFILLAIAWFVIWKTLPTWTGPVRNFLDNNVPPWSMYKITAGAQFLSALSAMMSSGMSDSESLSRLEEASAGWLRERISAIRILMAQGVPNIGEAMHQAGYEFPDNVVIQKLRGYAKANSALNESLDRLTRDWVNRQIKKMKRLSGFLEDLVTILNAAMAVWMLFGLQSIQDQMATGISGF
jgi:Type II secretory pathway, component PulF